MRSFRLLGVETWKILRLVYTETGGRAVHEGGHLYDERFRAECGSFYIGMLEMFGSEPEGWTGAGRLTARLSGTQNYAGTAPEVHASFGL